MVGCTSGGIGTNGTWEGSYVRGGTMDRGRGDVSDEVEAKDWKEALWDWDFLSSLH